MPLPPDPRGNSVDTPKNDAQIDARPNPQFQTPADKPIHHPGQTAVAPHPPSDIPHPTSQSTPPGLSESAALELAKLKSQLHALASPDGFAPTRDEFARAIRRTSRPYCKFFKTYDDFIRSCGLRSAVDRRRELAADQRAAAWAAARDPSPSSPAPSIANSNTDAHTDDQSRAHPIASHPSHSSDLSHASNPQSGKRKPKPRTNEPFYGDPIHCCEMAHAPVNEQGVVLLFGILARKLNYRIEMVRTGYPDCEAKRKGPDGKWRRLRIEFEFKTSRFNHDPAGCDLIVCWEDDANPTKLEVLELKNHVGQEPSKEPEPAVPLIAAPSDRCVPVTQLAAPSDHCVPSAAKETSAKEPDPAETSEPSPMDLPKPQSGDRLEPAA